MLSTGPRSLAIIWLIGKPARDSPSTWVMTSSARTPDMAAGPPATVLSTFAPASALAMAAPTTPKRMSCASLGGANTYRPAYAASVAALMLGGVAGDANAVSSGTLARMASHMSSPAMVERVIALRSLFSTSWVEAANNVSPSDCVENGWMPRLIDVWT